MTQDGGGQGPEACASPEDNGKVGTWALPQKAGEVAWGLSPPGSQCGASVAILVLPGLHRGHTTGRLELRDPDFPRPTVGPSPAS